MNVSAFGQVPGEDEPIRYPDDAKQIFIQDFEGSKDWQTIRLNEDENRPTTLYTWQAEPVDSIVELVYYKKSDSVGSFKISKPSDMDAEQFEIAGIRRDSIIYMYDGVVRTDAVQPDDRALSADSHAILDHDDDSQHGSNIGGKEYGLDRYGEDGGNQYFRYVSDNSDGVANRAGSDGDHYVPEYRRNLFVRNLPIEEKSSYRVTVFVKPTRNSVSEAIKPRIGLDLMRGYFHSEKSFLVDLVGKETTTWYGAKTTEFPTFSDKTSFTDLENGKWNKITLMAYYNNDEVGNASPYLLSYYWQTDWDWKVNLDENGCVAEEGTPATLRYIQQPAKYFVRLSFRSDSTTFDVDNLSLTKSWIGGVEYLNDMIRVDFGYKTNLGELAEAAKAENKIASVQLPGKYFDVWALWRDPDDPEEAFWENVPILSAEYQGDGYMYMWTEPTDEGDTRSFDGADSVLVSFFNPIDSLPLMLKYTGDQYPNGIDSAWAANKDNRIVFDFHNEIAALNPTINISPVTHQPVKSLAELAPVLQKEPFESGTFGLDPTTREITYKFSKNLSYDDKEVMSAKTKIILRGNGKEEYWTVKPYADGDISGWTTIVRPDKYDYVLPDGDYVLSFEQVTHLKNPDLDDSNDYGENIYLNYHFGDFEVAPVSRLVLNSDWRNDIVDKEADNKRPIPTSVYLHTGTDAFQKGKGIEAGNKCGFYNATRDSVTVLGTKIPDDGMFYLSNRNSGVTGNLYSIVTLAKGNYVISFKLGGHSTTDIAMQLKFYAKPSGDLEDGNDNGFKVLDGVANKTVLESGKKPAVNQGGSYGVTKGWKDGIETLSYNFSVPADGDYVFEWVAEGSSNYNGYCISNYWITTGGDLSLGPVSKVNEAIASAVEKLQAAAAAKYQGDDFDNLTSVKTTADGFIAAMKATKINQPSEYAAEVKVIEDAISKLDSRMKTVDAFDKAYADVEAKLAVYADSLKAYNGLEVVGALVDVESQYASYQYSAMTSDQITADTKVMNDAIKAVDDRQALNDALNKAITDAKALIKDPNASKYAAQYANLNDAIVEAEEFDFILASDDELKAQTAELNEAKSALEILLQAAEAITARIKSLDKLAKAVKADYGTAADDINARIATIDNDDVALANVMKSAIKVAIYNNIVNKGDTASALDVTGFIRNFNLYATPKIVERTNLKANSGDAKNADPDGANIQHVQHQWNSGDLNGQQPIWIMILENELDNLYPGWSVYATATGNCMVTCDDDTYGKLKEGVSLFDGQLAMDWNGKAELKATVEDLPLGVYNLSVQLKQNTGSNTVLSASSDTLKYTGNASAVNNIMVANGQMDIDFILTSGSGWSQADNFKLTYSADTAFNYTDLLSAAQAEFDQAVTIVDEIDAIDATVEYFSLGGIQLLAPEKGQIVIRKITIGDEVITDKIEF